MTWLDDLAAELGQTPLDDAERALLLDLARDVAHGTERRYAPLSAFLLGRAVDGGAAGGGDRGDRLRRLVERVRATVPDAERDDHG